MRVDKFFNKIYVINLEGMDTRLKKMERRMKKHDIQFQRFFAIDGRTKNLTFKESINKAKCLEMIYNVKILGRNNDEIKTDLPAVALTIGTVLILRHMVKHKIPRILICEDDIIFTHNFQKKFEQGIKELKKSGKKWDLIYLGCGNKCGNNEISEKKTSINRHASQITQFYPEMKLFVKNKNDLRSICRDNACKEISEHLSEPQNPKGTWCYGYSLKGAKKALKLIDNNVNNHIDQLLSDFIESKELKAVAFNPPIVMHEYGAFRPDSQIPWEW